MKRTSRVISSIEKDELQEMQESQHSQFYYIVEYGNCPVYKDKEKLVIEPAKGWVEIAWELYRTLYITTCPNCVNNTADHFGGVYLTISVPEGTFVIPFTWDEKLDSYPGWKNLFVLGVIKAGERCEFPYKLTADDIEKIIGNETSPPPIYDSALIGGF